MGYRVGQYLKTPEQYVGGVDPLAELVADIPNILAENQRWAREQKEERRKTRDKGANVLLTETMTGLTVQMDSEGDQYKNAEETLNYFDEFYADDPLMASYSAIHRARLDRFDRRQVTYKDNINDINASEMEIKKRLGAAYQTDELEVLLKDMRASYTESEKEFTAEEVKNYTAKMTELDTALETYRGLMGVAAEGLRQAEGVDEINPVLEYEAEDAQGNNDEYQNTLDQSWAAIQNGDYTQARVLFNAAQVDKIKAEGQFRDVQRGIDSYYMDNPAYDSTIPESEINPKTILNPDVAAVRYDINGIETSAVELLGNAEQLLVADDITGAQQALRRIPKTASDSRRRALIAIETAVGKQKSVIDEKYDNILPNIVDITHDKGYSDEVIESLKTLKATGKIDGGVNKYGLMALPERQAKTRETILDIINEGYDYRSDDNNPEVTELWRLMGMLEGATNKGDFNEDTGEWDKKPKELIREEIFTWLSEGTNATDALDWLDWSDKWLDDDTPNEEMVAILEDLIEVEEFSRPLSERADRYNNEVLRYAIEGR